MGARVIDPDAIFARACNAARMAVAEWEFTHGLLTQRERDLFAFAFAAGIAQGMREARRIDEEA